MVVVAEADLGDADRVVFVDDGQATPFEQSRDGVAHIEITLAVIEISRREQNLCGACARAGQALFVGLHEEGLTDSRAGLQVAQIRWPACEPEPADAGADSAGTD